MFSSLDKDKKGYSHSVNALSPSGQMLVFLAITFGMVLLCLLVCGGIGIVWNPVSASQQTLRLIVLQMISSIGIFIVPPLLFWRFFSPCGIRRGMLLFRAPVLAFLLALIILWACRPLIDFLAQIPREISLDNFPQFEQWVKGAFSQREDLIGQIIGYGSGWWGVVLSLLVFAVLPALGEEFFFRGTLQRIWAASSGKNNLVIVLTAFLFAVIHFDYYNFFGIFALGILLGYIYFLSGSLWVSVFFHFLNNAITVLALVYFYPDGTMDGQEGIFPWWVALLSLATVLWLLVQMKRYRSLTMDSKNS